MKSKLSFSCLLVIFVLISCKKSNEQISSEPDLGDNSPIEFSEAPSIDINLDSVILVNGQFYRDYVNEVGIQTFGTAKGVGDDPYFDLSPNEVKTRINAKFFQMGDKLVTRSNFNYPIEGTDRPAQSGLSYVYGGKIITERNAPHSSSVCKKYLYGLDCSGLVYQLFKNAKLNVPVGTADSQMQKEIIERALSIFPSTSVLKVFDKGKLDKIEFENGDIIGWNKLGGIASSKYTHIGIIIKTPGGRLAIYQSSGGPNQSCETNMQKGPRIIELTDNYFLGANASWKIIRIYAVDNGVPNTSNNLRVYNSLPIGGCQSGCTFAIMASGGTPPYKYSLNGFAWQTSNQFTTLTQPSKLGVKDANNFVAYFQY